MLPQNEIPASRNGCIQKPWALGVYAQATFTTTNTNMGTKLRTVMLYVPAVEPATKFYEV